MHRNPDLRYVLNLAQGGHVSELMTVSVLLVLLLLMQLLHAESSGVSNQGQKFNTNRTAEALRSNDSTVERCTVCVYCFANCIRVYTLTGHCIAALA